MKLDFVTITGADDSTYLSDLFLLSENYAVEWGILLSNKRTGTSRYPSKKWMDRTRLTCEIVKDKLNLNLSGHVCDDWVDQICDGDWSFKNQVPLFDSFKRIQLNFHGANRGSIDLNKFVSGISKNASDKRIIFQMDGVNNKLIETASPLLKENKIKFSGLYDLSSGDGVLPEQWDAPMEKIYTGYAGGLSPDNVAEQLKKIELKAGNRAIWIDVETKVRDSKDVLDVGFVEQFLRYSDPWVE